MSRDIIHRLAQARPAHLDPDLPPDPAVKDRELAAAFAASWGTRTPRRGTRRRRRRALAGGTVLVATAAGVAVALAVTGVAPGPVKPAMFRLASVLTYDGPPASATDVAAVLRKLARKAAAQPTPALGPVEYVKTMVWGQDLGKPVYGLDYRAHDREIQQNWQGAAGFAFTVRRPDGQLPDGPVPNGYYPVNPAHNWVWAHDNPATMPSAAAALRRYLLRYFTGVPRPTHVVRAVVNGRHVKLVVPVGEAPAEPPTPAALAVYLQAVHFMEREPLRPAVRASMLRLMATAVQRLSAARHLPDPTYHFLDLGAVTDRSGHRGIALAEGVYWMTEAVGVYGYRMVPTRGPSLDIVIFDPQTGSVLGQEWAECNGPVTNLGTAGKFCYSSAYVQYLQTKAVSALLRPPSAGKPASQPPAAPVSRPPPPAGRKATPGNAG